MNNRPIECLGVVLAGGLSSRMGQDKSQLSRTKATNMLDFSKQLLTNAGIKDIIVSGDNHQVPDLIPQSGPVGGIYSVLAHFLANNPEHLQPKALLILPVDLPLMTAAELSSLRIKGELSNKATFFQSMDKRAHHIPLYIPNNAYLSLFLASAFSGKAMLTQDANGLSNVKALSEGRSKDLSKNNLKKSGPSVRSMLEQVPHQAINCTNKNVLFNSNTPQDWRQAQSKF